MRQIDRIESSEEGAVAGRPAEDCPKPSVAPRMASLDPHLQRWDVIWAGGDETRVFELTRLICGEARPANVVKPSQLKHFEQEEEVAYGV